MATNDQGNQGGGTRRTSKRGFASMDPARQREIASEGGKAAHEKGTAHEFTSEEARRAGTKGGQAAHQKGTAHEFDSEEAREAGRKGGQASHSSTAKQSGTSSGNSADS
jgi:general stress protein YciG